MKTKNNVQKAITKSLAVIISLVLLSITVNAQEFWKSVLKNNSFTQIAMAMTSENNESSYLTGYSAEAASFSELFEVEAEPALSVEDWMTNETLFSGVSGMLQPEAETSLELEGWMMNEESFGVRTIIILDETEKTLELENWMTDNKVWEM